MKCKCCGKELPVTEFRTTGKGMMKTCISCFKQHCSEAAKKAINEKSELNKVKQDLEIANTKRLQDFTPRDLLAELKRRGYKWEDMYVIQKVDWNKI